MKDTVGILVLTFLVRVNGEAPRGGYCVEKQCFAVFQEQIDFVTAKNNCEETNGHLMTVRSLISHSVLLILLGVHTGNYWIGLQLPSGQCPNEELGLRGFRWITGDNETKFQNWRNFDDVCSSKCISVSKYEFIWKEQACNSKLDGFICEYKNESPCQRINVNVDESVLYKTLLKFEGDNLLTLPMGTIASLKSFGSKYICVSEEWMKAPWSCEIFNGGCAYNCSSANHKNVCVCPPGKTLQDNNITCEDDPCHGLGCAHHCQKKSDIYTCMCRNGYTLAEDGKECKEIDYCVDHRQCPGEHSECVSMPALQRFECQCQVGYELKNDTCVDVDECFMAPCEHHCTNTDGSYICYCNPEFIPMPKDPNKCEFICLEAHCRPICDHSANYQCKCPNGYILDEDICSDIDECNMGHCHHNCINTYGSYICLCDEGFDLVGTYECVKREPSVSSGLTPYTPTLMHPTETPAKAGVFLGMFVCIVIVIFVMITLIHLVLKRRGKFDFAFERQSANCNDLQQITSDKYKNLSFDGYVIYDNQYVID